MTTSPSKSISEPAIIEQVITEFFAKSLHIILESRSPYVSSRNYGADMFSPSPASSPLSSSSGKPRHKWFNLALKDCPAALENFDLWRQSNLEPLVVDVILVKRRSKVLPSNNSWSSGHDEFFSNSKSEKIIERWVVQYESRRSSDIPSTYKSGTSSGSGNSSSHSTEIPSTYKKTYKRTIVLLRSLYVMVRLLPAYKVFRDLNSTARLCDFSLSHKISSFVEPFTRTEDAEMSQFNFTSVDTPCGKLSLSVSYLPMLDDLSSETSTPISPQFIHDYVGSPTTDPLKRLHSLPSPGSLPNYISFSRRHSWSNDLVNEPSLSPSPSPTYSDSRAMNYNQSPNLPPRTYSTSHNLWPLTHKQNTSFDECYPTPPFSPYSSPSPPVVSNSSLLRSESAPVAIPLSRTGATSRLVGQGLPPSPSPNSKKLLRAQMNAQNCSPDNKLQVKKGMGELHTGMTLQKILYSGKDEVGNLSGRKLSSCSSPRIHSRSSSRFSFMDDDPEFTCPFAVDDEDLAIPSRSETSDTDTHATENSFSGELVPIRRSPDAVVGALVRMLKTAAPLRQETRNLTSSSTQILSEEATNQVDLENLNASSSLFKSRTAIDALQELNAYKEMKEKLLRQSISHVDKAESVEQDEIDDQPENFALESSSGFY